MKKSTIIFIFVFFIAFFFVLNPLAKSSNLQPTTKVLKLINYMKNNSFVETEAIKIIESGLSNNEVENITNWMDKHPEKVIPWYYANMADSILKTGHNQKAMEYFYKGLFRTFEDVQMCNDNYARNLPMIIRNMGQKTQAVIVHKDKTFQKNLMLKVLDWDEKTPRFEHPEWSCLMGNKDHSIKSMNEYNKTITGSIADLRKSVNEQQ